MRTFFGRWFTFKSSEKCTDENISNQWKGPADFETAIEATCFGKFNILILLLAMFSGWAYLFETMNISFIVSEAEEDLGLTLEQKGLLLSIPYFGTLTGGLFWAYLSDTLGRKKLLVIGYFLGSLFAFLAGISQSIHFLVFCKFMGGLVQSGPSAILTTTLSEYHCARFRAKIILYTGITLSIASIFLPVVAMLLLGTPINLQLLNGYIILRSWNLFLIVCCLPSLISAIGHLFVPESPKFLMTSRRNDKALNVLKKVYSINTGKDPDSYPIKELLDERNSETNSTISSNKLQALKNGLVQFKPLFMRPHLKKMVLVVIIQIASILCTNSIRLWLPQLFSAISDFETANHNEKSNICAMIESLTSNNKTTNGTTNASVYTNLMIVYAITITGYLIFTALVNKYGKKPLFIGSKLLASAFTLCIYFAKDSLAATVMTSFSVALLLINTDLLSSIIVDLFPTTIRTMALSLTSVSGRLGSIMGNILFPYLLRSGCLTPFLVLTLILIGCAILIIFMPKTDLKPLE